jgi:3-methyladenine DNA glycosylase AlkD
MANKFHQEIISSIKNISENPKPNFDGFGLKYVGTQKPSFHLNTKAMRDIAKDFVKSHSLSHKEYLDLLDALYYGESYDEIIIAALIVGHAKDLRQNLDPKNLHHWVTNTHGWAECDVLCQMAFDADDFLNHWSVWEKALRAFAKDNNIQVRRASLVLLTKPFRQSGDSRFVAVALHNLDTLRSEKDILITKAVSWVLRSMIKFHKEKVSSYLKENLDYLPKIAIREVRSKLDTGKKYVNKKKSN